ncbi:MAG: carbohydrate binding domain-containing protein [Patescibacteria group bacterium]|nr:carbohydrate binding domain-containing protein [Patescibacteria group bacterium]
MYRQIVNLACPCLAVIAMAGAVAGAELNVPNGSFEQGDGAQPEAWAWGDAPEGMLAERTVGTAHDGNRAVRVRVPGELSPGTAWSLRCTAPISVDAGKQYTASFWLKAACDRPVYLLVSGYHEGVRVNRSLVRVLGFGPCNWRQFEAGFTVPQGVSSVRLSFSGKLGSDLLLDDVAIRPGHLAYLPEGTRVEVHLKNHADEKLDRGLVAVRKPEGVYIGWRLLRDDPERIAFHLDRKTEDGRLVRVSTAPVVDTTDLLDTAPQAKEATGYRLCEIRDGRERELAVCRVDACEPEAAYRTVALEWPDNRPVSDVEKVGIGDLDGDGRYDFVLKHPTGKVLLWDDYTKWNRSPDTYKIDAFTADGKHLWRRDLGWGIEHRNWHSPMIVHDLNGDGRAEVVAKVADGDLRNERGRVVDGPEWVAVWDGLTGKEIARAPWPSRGGFGSYNFASRHQLAVAYLDGRTPCLIALRGTYGLMKVEAYELVGEQLRPLWQFCNANAPSKFVGQGAHFTQCADVDGDGRDEVVLGSMVLDDTGVPLWSTGKGHPDGLFLGDIDPLRPGLEVYYNVETRNATGGMILVDAATGATIWELQTPTYHVHGGMCADLDPASPGLECFGVDKNRVGESEQIVGTWLKTATGQPLESPTDWGFGRMTVYWDADPQKELIFGRSIQKYQGTARWPIPAFLFVPVDLLGDWREELLEFTEAGELRIHVSAIPATDRRVCLMQDPIYRRDVAMCAMGYHRPAMLSYCPGAAAPGER